MFRAFVSVFLIAFTFAAQPASASPGIYSYVMARSYNSAECMRRAKVIISHNPAMRTVSDQSSVLLQSTEADVSYNIRCDIPDRILLITAGTEDLVARMTLLRRVFDEVQ